MLRVIQDTLVACECKNKSYIDFEQLGLASNSHGYIKDITVKKVLSMTDDIRLILTSL